MPPLENLSMIRLVKHVERTSGIIESKCDIHTHSCDTFKPVLRVQPHLDRQAITRRPSEHLVFSNKTARSQIRLKLVLQNYLGHTIPLVLHQQRFCTYDEHLLDLGQDIIHSSRPDLVRKLLARELPRGRHFPWSPIIKMGFFED